MAYKTNLTPIAGDDVDETSAAFMNMKFGELLGNTEDNRQQISILNGVYTTHTANIDAHNIARRFGAMETVGILDFNDVTNTQPGAGVTLLKGNALNAPPGFTSNDFFHTFNIEYGFAKNGTGNITQFAIPYSLNMHTGMLMRGRFNGVWTPWSKFATTDKIDILSSNMLSGWTISGGMTLTKVGNLITLQGSIQAGTKTANTSLIQLPSSIYYPPTQRYFPCDCYTGATSKMDRYSFGLTTSGVLSTRGYDLSAYTYIDINISWAVNS